MKGNSTHMPLSPDILKDWTVLVVDDEPDSAEIVQALLEVYGAHVLTAANGRDGLEMIRRHRPRFVITDLTMPEMSGWELRRALEKDDRALAEIPVVALTAHAMEGDRDKAISMGFRNYLTKPLHPETFVNRLLRLLADDMPELAELLDAS